MPPTAGDPLQLQVLYWAFALLIALVGSAWKAAGMRGSLNETWADRVDVLKTGLSEGAVQELKDLRARIDELLGAENDLYESTTADPATLLQSVQRFEKLMRIVRGGSANFEWLLRLGNIMVMSLLAMIFGVIILALQLSNLVQLKYQSVAGAILLGTGVIVGVVCFIMYWVLQNKLSGAEILAQTVAE